MNIAAKTTEGGMFWGWWWYFAVVVGDGILKVLCSGGDILQGVVAIFYRCGGDILQAVFRGGVSMRIWAK